MGSMGLAAQQFVFVLLLLSLGGYFIAASINPTGRYLKFAYWTWFGFLLRSVFGRPQPTLFERVSNAIFGLLMLAAAAFVATIHLA
jgi:hypothetical protein